MELSGARFLAIPHAILHPADSIIENCDKDGRKEYCHERIMTLALKILSSPNPVAKPNTPIANVAAQKGPWKGNLPLSPRSTRLGLLLNTSNHAVGNHY